MSMVTRENWLMTTYSCPHFFNKIPLVYTLKLTAIHVKHKNSMPTAINSLCRSSSMSSPSTPQFDGIPWSWSFSPLNCGGTPEQRDFPQQWWS